MHPKLTARVGAALGIEPIQTVVGYHTDGDDEVQINENLRGMNVFIVQPLVKPLSLWLCQLLVLIDAVKRASARRVIAVIPYYPGRQDRKDRPRKPITARLVADLLVAAGVERIVVLDLHALQIEGFFPNRVQVDHLRAHPLVATHLKHDGYAGAHVVFAGPDGNATKRFARPLVEAFPGAGIASIEKVRSGDRTVEKLFALGDVGGKRLVLVDDMVTTGGTMLNAVLEFRKQGAGESEIIATHAVMIGEAYDVLANPLITRIVITNSLPTSVAGLAAIASKLSIIDIAPLLAEAIKRVHMDEQVGPILGIEYWSEREIVTVTPEENDAPSVLFWGALSAYLPKIALRS